MNLRDTYRLKGLRKQLVEELRHKGIEDPNVLMAIGMVPRHNFHFDPTFYEHAYQDKAFPIEAGQTISQPYTVAYQSVLLEVDRSQRVLEIGTGSGYQAAVLSLLAQKVYTIERHGVLFEKTNAILHALGYRNITTMHGDGFKGMPAFAPFDRIIITAAAPYIPEALKEQLSVGGRMVLPLEEGKHQRMMRLTRLSETEFEQEQFEEFRFVPMLQGKT